MEHARRWILIALLATGLIWSSSATPAQEVEFGGGDNTAVAVNTKDGSSKIKVSFRVVKVKGDVVDQGNVAVAFASCDECRTMAVAFQLVLVESDPSVVTPANLAVAVNIECTSCETLASAYQWVRGVDGNLHITDDAKRALARVRTAVKELLRSDLSIEEIQAELDALADEFEQAIAEALAAAAPAGSSAEVVQDGPSEGGSVDLGQENGDVLDDEPSPASATTPAPSPTPTDSPTAEPTTPAPTEASPSPTTSP
jgi:putative peptide zinc metalloprotease protein